MVRLHHITFEFRSWWMGIGNSHRLINGNCGIQMGAGMGIGLNEQEWEEMIIKNNFPLICGEQLARFSATDVFSVRQLEINDSVFILNN